MTQFHIAATCEDIAECKTPPETLLYNCQSTKMAENVDYFDRDEVDEE